MEKRWIVLIGLVSARLAFGFQFQAVAAVGAGISQSFALSATEYGILIGLFMAPGIVMSLTGGLALQRLGDRKVMRFAMILITLGALLSALSSGYELLAIGRLVAGIGAVLIGVAANKLAYEWFEGRELLTATSVNLAGVPVGIGLAFALLGPLNDAAGWQVAFFLVFAVSCVALLLVWLFVDQVASSTRISHEFVNGRELLLSLIIGISWGAANAALTTAHAFAPPLLASRGVSPMEIGILVALGPVVAALSVAMGGMTADRFAEPGRLVLWGFGLWALLQPLLIPFAGIHWIVALIMIVTAIAGAAPLGVLVAGAGQAARPQSRAVAMGIFFTIFYALGLIAPPVAGAAVDISGAAGIPMVVTSCWLVVSILSYGLFRRLMAQN